MQTADWPVHFFAWGSDQPHEYQQRCGIGRRPLRMRGPKPSGGRKSRGSSEYLRAPHHQRSRPSAGNRGGKVRSEMSCRRTSHWKDYVEQRWERNDMETAICIIFNACNLLDIFRNWLRDRFMFQIFRKHEGKSHLYRKCSFISIKRHFILFSDGIELPLNEQQEVTPLGKLTILHVTKDRDEGQYECRATDRRGRNDSKTFQLTITGKIITLNTIYTSL